MTVDRIAYSLDPNEEMDRIAGDILNEASGKIRLTVELRTPPNERSRIITHIMNQAVHRGFCVRIFPGSFDIMLEAAGACRRH